MGLGSAAKIAASTVAGAAGGSVVPGIGTLIGGIGGAAVGILGAILTYVGMKKQEKQYNTLFASNEAEKRFNQGVTQKTIAEQIRSNKVGEKLQAGQLGLEKEKFAYDQSQTAKKWEWDNENKQYTRAWDMAKNFQGLLDKETTYKNQLINIWRRA